MQSTHPSDFAHALKPAAAGAEVVAWLRQHPALKQPLARPVGTLPTGIVGLDQALGGGLPTGAISELVGPGSSGRTSLALAIAAAATCRGERAAWIDPADTLDPRSAEQGGVALAHFLWVRPQGAEGLKLALKAADLVLDAGGFALLVLDLAGQGERAPWSRGAWWIRLSRRLRGMRTALVVLSPREQAGSSAAVRLDCRGRRWQVRATVLKHRGHYPGGVVQLALAPPED